MCYGRFARHKNYFLGETISGLALLLFANPLTLLEQTSGVARVILGSLAVPIRFFLGAHFSKMVPARRHRSKNDPLSANVPRGTRPFRPEYASGWRRRHTADLRLRRRLRGTRAADRRTTITRAGGANKIRNANAVGVEMQVAAGEEVAAPRKRNVVARDHRVRFALHRTIRDGLGRDGRIRGTGRRGRGKPARGRAGNFRSADHHSRGTFRRDSRR